MKMPLDDPPFVKEDKEYLLDKGGGGKGNRRGYQYEMRYGQLRRRPAHERWSRRQTRKPSCDKGHGIALMPCNVFLVYLSGFFGEISILSSDSVHYRNLSQFKTQQETRPY